MNKRIEDNKKYLEENYYSQFRVCKVKELIKEIWKQSISEISIKIH